MRVLVAASRKGGVGKTTVACHLAVEAERQGAGPIAILDMDPMQGMAQWWEARSDESPALFKGTLAEALDVLPGQGFKILIIDTPPSIGPEVAQAVGAASLVIIPVQASPNDLRAVGSTIELVNAARKPLTFILTRVKPRVRLTTQAYEALSPHGTIAPPMYDRTDYAAAMIDGLTAQELGGSGPASAEMASLWTYTATRLDLAV